MIYRGEEGAGGRKGRGEGRGGGKEEGQKHTEYRSIFKFCNVCSTSPVVMALKDPISSTLTSPPLPSSVSRSTTVSAQ